MHWFKEIFGFTETLENINKYITFDFTNNKIISTANNKEFLFGELKVKSLKELRKELIVKESSSQNIKGSIKISQRIGNIKNIHYENKDVLIQVASQFNLLEMMYPEQTPQQGITIYVDDHTQGPICAMSCAAGTLYRNYKTNINTLSNIEKLFTKEYWYMKNGYTIFNNIDITEFNKEVYINQEKIKEELLFGIQENTEVMNTNHTLSQIYCSAIPISYITNVLEKDLERFSKLILDSAYEATFISAILNPLSNKVFLTYLGGGAFGNKLEWIYDSIEKNCEKFKEYNLEIIIIKYSHGVDKKIEEISTKYN